MVVLSVMTTLPFTAAFYERIVVNTPPAWTAPPRTTPAYNLVVVPGNPGQPGFYASFVDELMPVLPQDCSWRVSVLGLRGHVTGATRRKVRRSFFFLQMEVLIYHKRS
jgi:hypothetical protein